MGEMREVIRSNIERCIAESKFSQKEVAEKLGVSQSSITNWIKGKNSPDVDLVIPICNLFGISVAELFSDGDFSETKNSPSTAEAAPGEDVQKLLASLDKFLVNMGYISANDDVTDQQQEVLLGICRILRATFEKK